MDKHILKGSNAMIEQTITIKPTLKEALHMQSILEAAGETALAAMLHAALTPKKPRTKRDPAKFNPCDVYIKEGLDALREALEPLDLDELKDIIKQYSLDRRAMQWNRRERVEQIILEVVPRRAHKGSAFLER